MTGSPAPRSRPPLPEPVATPQTAPYWEMAAAGLLALRRCSSCSAAFHGAVDCCPACGSGATEWFAASGRARLYSYVIVHRGEGGFAERTPYAVAVVELEEGPRMLTGIAGVDPTPESLVLDMPLQVVFEERGGYALPVFAPADGGPE
ncbi:MAG TPA: OB-fold domain-containing protein [Spirillospora sp.]|nr:OB-fold domain-containing protein [Spirillospora sp.]